MSMRISMRALTLVAVVAFPVSAFSQSQPVVAAAPTLATSGQGGAKVTPDRASVHVNVQTRGATAAAAAADNAQRTKAVLDALTKLGRSREQLGTEGYTVYPE